MSLEIYEDCVTEKPKTPENSISAVILACPQARMRQDDWRKG